jgi:NAD-dependent DNA ligase
VRFDVFQRVKGGKLAPKGMVEVREVSDEFSVAGVAGELDIYNPIAPGDVVANPHFSRSREKVFFLLGTFPGHGKAFLEKRLEDLGAQVSTMVDSNVDFLVLGEKEPAEDALELSETPEYKLAQEYGIQVLRIGDIDRFLRL